MTVNKCSDCGIKVHMITISGSPPKGRCLSCDARFSRKRYWASQAKKEKCILEEIEAEKDEQQTRISDW